MPNARAQLQPSQIRAPAQHALDRLSAAAFGRRRAIGHVRMISERRIRSLGRRLRARSVKPGAGVFASLLRDNAAAQPTLYTPTALNKFSNCHRKVLNRRLTRRAE